MTIPDENLQVESCAPKRVLVFEVLSSRYAPGKRPTSWDERFAGVEKIKTSSGEIITLYSNGGQSSPAPGWELLLMDNVSNLKNTKAASLWTLYGIQPKH